MWSAGSKSRWIMRGGARKVEKKRKGNSALTAVVDAYNSVPQINRYYLSLILLCSAVAMTGLPAAELFALTPSVTQLWRPLTSAAFFGTPSMSMANSIYFLLRYGQVLERMDGSGAYAFFLTVQIAVLSALALLLGFPFTSQAMVSAIIYACSRVSPMDRIPFQFGLTITSWQLPFCMMIIDCLSQQSGSAAWPHLLGIFSGHLFHFLHFVLPQLGGTQWLQTPAFFTRRLGGRPGPLGAKKDSPAPRTTRKPKSKGHALG